MLHSHSRTRVARDLAAPMKYAITSFLSGECLRAMTSAAAHQIAAVDADRAGVALTPERAVEADRHVRVAERRRRLEVDEVLRCR